MDHLDQKERKENLDYRELLEQEVFQVPKDQREILVLQVFLEIQESKVQVESRESLVNPVMMESKVTLDNLETQDHEVILVFKGHLDERYLHKFSKIGIYCTRWLK